MTSHKISVRSVKTSAHAVVKGEWKTKLLFFKANEVEDEVKVENKVRLKIKTERTIAVNGFYRKSDKWVMLYKAVQNPHKSKNENRYREKVLRILLSGYHIETNS